MDLQLDFARRMVVLGLIHQSLPHLGSSEIAASLLDEVPGSGVPKP